MSENSPSAALLVIGNEILSGRTQDVNVNYIAKKLSGIGVPLKEVRVVPDVEGEIIEALNALRRRFAYVFTTGGIGPTHDDITIDSIAKAFGVPVVEDPKARALLAHHFGVDNLTVARLRMARVPVGATLIDNPISAAPGVKMENVYVMAGVPEVMRAMMDGVVPTLKPGPRIYSVTVSGVIAESVIAEELRALAVRFPKVDIGSYPWVKEQKFGTSLVARGVDLESVRLVESELAAMMKAQGVDVIKMDA